MGFFGMNGPGRHAKSNYYNVVTSSSSNANNSLSFVSDVKNKKERK
jgi:hypothetical protein